MSSDQRSTSRAASVVLYTQPHCSACRQVERYLEERGVPFERRDVAADARALDDIVSRGYMATPVTRIGDEWIPGFRREAFDQTLARLNAS